MRTTRRRFNQLLSSGPILTWASSLFSNRLSANSSAEAAAPLLSSSTSRTTQTGKWYERLTAGVHLDYHYPEWDPYIISKADGQKIIQRMAEIGSELVVVFAKCHYGNSYYNTKVGHKHQNLGSRDLLAECALEAPKHKITLLAYYSINRDVWAGQQHPEWRMKDAEGNIVDEDRWPPQWAAMGFLCYNSPYLDYVKAQVEEIMEYDVKGFHFDMLWFGGTGKVCYCNEYCRPLFRQRYGIDMPSRPTWDDAWRKFLEFRYDSNARFCDELNQVIRRKRPDLSIMYNYHGTPPSSWQVGMLPVKHRLSSDYGTGEGYPPNHGHTYASFMSCFLGGLKPGSPWQGVTSRYTRTMNDHTVRPLAEMKWETFTFLSHGGMPLFVDTPEDDGLTLDPVAYDRMGAVFQEAKKKAEFFGHEHQRQVALYFSSKTRDWYGREDAETYFRSFMGAHQILIESHIPVEFVFDETVTLETLSRFPVIFLANTAILDQREIELIRHYVEQGGRLLATFETSRFDVGGREQPELGLSQVLGVRYQRKTEFNANYFRLPAGVFSEGIHPDWDIFIQGPNNVVAATVGESAGELKIAFHDRDLTTHMGHAPHNSPWKAVGPAVIVHRYGKGQTIYVPFSPEAAYLGNYPLVEHRLFVRNLIRSLSPTLPISIEAPLGIESIITEDKANRRYIVHLVSFTGVRDGHAQTYPGVQILGRSKLQPPVPSMEESNLYRARIVMSSPFKTIHALGSNSEVKMQGNEILLQSQEVHDAVVINY